VYTRPKKVARVSHERDTPFDICRILTRNVRIVV